MGLINVANINIRSIFLGNAGVYAVYLGKELVWPTDVPDRLLAEDGRGFWDVVGGDETGTKKILQIDRSTTQKTD